VYWIVGYKKGRENDIKKSFLPFSGMLFLAAVVVGFIVKG